MLSASELFRTFQFNRDNPQIPVALLQLMVSGSELIEVDEKLFFHIKFHLRSLIFFESPYRFGIRVGPSAGDIAEFIYENERFFIRPPGLIEN